MKLVGHKFFVLACMLTLLLQAGCGQQAHINELSKKQWIPEEAHWPELDVLIQDPNDPLAPSVSRMFKLTYGGGSDPAEAPQFCRMIDDPRFVANLKKFEETPIPAKYATPEREANKKAVLDAFAELKQGCVKKAPRAAQLATFTKVDASLKKVWEIPGQKPPQGEEAKRYTPTGDPNKK